MKSKMTWLYPTFWSILIGSIFPILASETLKSAPPFLTLTITFFIAAIALGIVIIFQKKTKELSHKSAWKYAFYTGIFNGVLFYGFYYFGLLTTSPWNAALVAQTEVVFSFLYFQAWHKESLSKNHIIGALLLILWAVYLIIPRTSWWNHGDILVLIGMMFAPLGNYYQKKWRTKISAQTFLFMRYICTIPFVFTISFMRNEIGTPLWYNILWQMALMGIMVFVIKNILWVESIRLVTVTRILALHGFMPFLTIILVWWIYWNLPTQAQLMSGIPMIIWVYFLSKE